MPTAKGPPAQTTGSAHFDPDAFFNSWATNASTLFPQNNNLRSSIIAAFNLAHSDSYVYHAIASVTLSQVQEAIDHGAGDEGQLHNWYPNDEGKPSDLPPPSPGDIEAYTSIFSPSTSTPKALIAFSSNARKSTHRARVSAHLSSHRLFPSSLTLPRSKTHINPYYDFWTWSCHCLQWCGPTPSMEKVKHSHAILPVLMHHFGCLCPSYEALSLISLVAKKRPVLEIGSGNGYWTFLLRRLGLSVTAVDNLQSKYRTTWISDTVVAEGESYLKKNGGAKEMVLVLVYPITSLDFTARVVRAYKGDTVVVAGTQNGNGYTGFRDKGVEEWMVEMMGGWEKRGQVALPSFAGKDEGMFVFERGEKRA